MGVPIEPFTTYYRDNPDYNAADAMAETKALFLRQGLIEDWLEGKGSLDTVLDCLAEQGIGADDYMAVVDDNVEYVVDNGIFYRETDAGIFIPA